MKRILGVLISGLLVSMLAAAGGDPIEGLKKKLNKTEPEVGSVVGEGLQKKQDKPAPKAGGDLGEGLKKKQNKPVPKKGVKAKDKAKDKNAKPGEEPGKKKKLPEFKKKEEDAPKAEDLIASIRKNMEASQDRLKNKDPKKETQDIQKKILDDLDKLINQENNNKKNQQNAKQQPQSGSKKEKKGNNQQSKAKPGGNAKMNPGKKKSGKKGTQGDQVAKAGSKPGAVGTGGGSKKQKETKRLIDEHPDFWGHLPKRKRLELDAYSRERFMPGYEDVLIEYYRSISQMGK